ncbi:sporulation histidine kinase inhibitor Sda [Alkalicoccobacillus gibsonii]
MLADFSDEELVQVYKEACTRGLATNFIEVLKEELISREIFTFFLIT